MSPLVNRGPTPKKPGSDPDRRRGQTPALLGSDPGSLAALFGLAVIGAQPVFAQSYPVKPVRMIVPFAPGGGSDLVGRVLAQRLTGALGQQVVVENRAGAGGRIGTELAARAPADGYTLLFATSSVMVTAPALYAKLPFDMPKDFAPISLVASTAYVLVVHPSVPARSVRDFIAIAKQAPDKLSYASSGPGGPAHLAGELFEALAGVKMVHVPYKGSSPGTMSVVAGETDAMFSNLLPALPAIRSGRLRALGVTSARPSAIVAGVPTMASTLPGFEVEQLYAALAPAGTPREIVRRLNAEIHKAVQNADVKAKLATDGSEVHTGTPEELERRIVAEIAKWSKVIKAAGIKDE